MSMKPNDREIYILRCVENARSKEYHYALKDGGFAAHVPTSVPLHLSKFREDLLYFTDKEVADAHVAEIMSAGRFSYVGAEPAGPKLKSAILASDITR